MVYGHPFHPFQWESQHHGAWLEKNPHGLMTGPNLPTKKRATWRWIPRITALVP